jgi:hypothetical protein
MKITITKREYNQFYIHNYYDAPKKAIRIMRLYMGPTLTLVSLYLYYMHKDKINLFIFGFLLAYGIFYTVKPLILLLAMQAKNETFNYEIADYKLHIKDRINEGTIDLKKNKLEENKKYFLVKLENKQIIFFPKEKLSEKVQRMFRKNMVS